MMKIMKMALLFLSILVFSSADTSKFNILIIGDSISIGYTPFVQTSMASKANIVHNTGNAQATSYGLANVSSWIGTTKWDVIQFNWGLWDLAYRTAGRTDLNKATGVLTTSLEDYRINLEAIIQKLLATKAKLIFVTTTYVPVDEPGRIAGDEDAYNVVAKSVMLKYSITVTDITAYSKTIHLNSLYGQGSNNVHYTTAGYELLAAKITAGLEAALVGMTPPQPTTSVDRYVSTTGSDESGDGTQGNPFATLSKAYTVSSDGDVINIAAGTYTTTGIGTGTYISLTKSITIKGAGAGNTILQLGTSPVSQTDLNHGRYFNATVTGVSIAIEDLTIRNCGWYTSNLGGAIINIGTGAGINAAITRCNLESSMARTGAAIQVTGGTSSSVNLATIEDCYFGENFVLPRQDPASVGSAYETTNINLYIGAAVNAGAAGSIILQNCVFYKNGSIDNPLNLATGGASTSGRVINFNSTTSGSYATVTNCTFLDNVAIGAPSTAAVSCFNITAASTTFKFMNNILVDNTAVGAAVDFSANATFAQNPTFFKNFKANLISKIAIDAGFSLENQNSISADYIKTSAFVLVNGGASPLVIANKTGVKTIVAKGTKIIEKGVFDVDVKSVDMNGITRDPTVDLGAVQSVSISLGVPENQQNSSKVIVKNRVATLSLENRSMVIIYNSNGQVQFSTFNDAGTLDIPFKNAGIYILKIASIFKTETFKLVI